MIKVLILCFFVVSAGAVGLDLSVEDPAAMKKWPSIPAALKWEMWAEYIQQLSAEDSTNDYLWTSYLKLKAYSMDERVAWFRGIRVLDLKEKSEYQRIMRVRQHLATLDTKERDRQVAWLRERAALSKQLKFERKVAQALAAPVDAKN